MRSKLLLRSEVERSTRFAARSKKCCMQQKCCAAFLLAARLFEHLPIYGVTLNLFFCFRWKTKNAAGAREM